jgi:hypothetical protein
MKKTPSKVETPEIDPEKWSEFEATLKRALDMPHKPHKPVKPEKPAKKRDQKPKA